MSVLVSLLLPSARRLFFHLTPSLCCAISLIEVFLLFPRLISPRMFVPSPPFNFRLFPGSCCFSYLHPGTRGVCHEIDLEDDFVTFCERCPTVRLRARTAVALRTVANGCERPSNAGRTRDLQSSTNPSLRIPEKTCCNSIDDVNSPNITQPRSLFLCLILCVYKI